MFIAYPSMCNSLSDCNNHQRYFCVLTHLTLMYTLRIEQIQGPSNVLEHASGIGRNKCETAHSCYFSNSGETSRSTPNFKKKDNKARKTTQCKQSKHKNQNIIERQCQCQRLIAKKYRDEKKVKYPSFSCALNA